MRFEEYVPDYVLRNYLRVGQRVTILKNSRLSAQVPSNPEMKPWSMLTLNDVPAEIVNFLPGYTEVYAPHKVHNHQVVWKDDDVYYSTDINNVKEVRDAD